MMKRNLRLIIILALILALSIGIYAAVSLTGKSGESEEAETTAIRLNDLSDAAVITVRNQNGTMEFKNMGDSWSYTGDATLKLDPAKLAGIKQAIIGLTASRELEAADTLSSYGLGQGCITVTADDGKGNVFSVDIGNEVPTGGGHYALISGADKIFIIPNDLYDASVFSIDDILLSE